MNSFEKTIGTVLWSAIAIYGAYYIFSSLYFIKNGKTNVEVPTSNAGARG